MSVSNRQNLILLVSLAVALLAILLLAAGVSQLQFDPGVLFDQATRDELRALFLGQISTLRTLAIVLLLLSPLALLLMPRGKRRRKEDAPPKLTVRSFLVMMIQAIMWTIALVLIRRSLGDSGLQLTPVTEAEMPPLEALEAGQAAFLQIPEWISFAFSLALIFLVVLILWSAWKRRQRSGTALGQLAQEAQFALDEMEAGGDFRSVILRCYYDMSRALSYHRGIQRKQGMTPREFELRLLDMGLPGQPVADLTRLFELVRYGAREPGAPAERQAVACLEKIVQACGEKA